MLGLVESGVYPTSVDYDYEITTRLNCRQYGRIIHNSSITVALALNANAVENPKRDTRSRQQVTSRFRRSAGGERFVIGHVGHNRPQTQSIHRRMQGIENTGFAS